MNRLTITLDDDLYAMARAHALANKLSLSKAIADLLRRPQISSPPQSLAAGAPGLHPLSGFPVSVGNGRPITEADLQRAEDDEIIRHLEVAGLSPEEIEKALQ